MLNQIFRKAGKHVVHKAASHQTRPGGFLDLRFGFDLLRDRRVPVAPKVMSLALGVVLTAGLMAFEVPFEALLGLFLPVVGLAADAFIDGLEFVAMPLLFACWLLPRLAPRQVVEYARSGRRTNL